MKCGKAKKLIYDYLDGLLSPKERARLTEHLDTCADCRRRLEQTRELLELLKRKSKSPQELPEGYWVSFWPRLRDRIRLEQAGERRKVFLSLPYFGKPVPAIALGSILVILALVVAGVAVLKKNVPWDGLPPTGYPVFSSGDGVDFILARAVSSEEESGGENDFALASVGVPGGAERREGDFILACADCPGVNGSGDIVNSPFRSSRSRGESSIQPGGVEHVLACGFGGGRGERIFW